MIRIKLACCLFLIFISCQHDSSIINYYKQLREKKHINIIPQLWIDSSNSLYIYRDIQPYELIFEENFNDSMILFNNEHLLAHTFVHTERNLESSITHFYIYDSLSTSPAMAIFLPQKNYVIAFNLNRMYKFYYVNLLKDAWSVDFSNSERLYY